MIKHIIQMLAVFIALPIMFALIVLMFLFDKLEKYLP